LLIFSKQDWTIFFVKVNPSSYLNIISSKTENQVFQSQFKVTYTLIDYVFSKKNIKKFCSKIYQLIKKQI